MTTTGSNITKDMTPAEAVNLLEKLEAGHQAAWLSTHEAQWQTGEYQSRFQNAAEVDGVFRDIMWETVENGMRRPGEPVEAFAEPITQQAYAGATPQHAGDSRDAIADRLLNDASTPEGQAYTRAFSDTAVAHVKELRERDPLPEPDRTPGAPHPEPFLAERGWHMHDRGIYTRRSEPQAAPRLEKELEAG